LHHFRIMPRFTLLFAGACALLLNAAAANPSKTNPVETGVGPVTLDEYTARRIAQIAIADDRQVADPGPADFEITSLLLGYAQRFSPGDAALIRMRVGTAITGGDQDTMIQQTRELIAVNPDDAVAQLRLISNIINQQQTVDGRIALVERFLGPSGETIPAEVRSRLALDAALWHRDRGDDEAFVRFLVMATTLDSTNKLAAYLAANYHAANVYDPTGRLELLVNLLLADPLDPQTHLAIATELAGAGAFEQALRFQRNALNLAQTADEFDPAHIVRGQIVLIWHVEGPQAVVNILNTRLAKKRDEIARQLREAEAAGSVVIDPPDPGDQNLSFADERIRMLAATVAGDTATAASAVGAMRASIPQYLGELEERGVPADQIERNRAVLETEFALTRLWVGLDVPEAITDANRLIDQFGTDTGEQDAIHLLKAFVAVRSNEPDVALDLLAQVEQDTIFGDVARSLAGSLQGDTDMVRQVLEKLATDQPADPVGAWALSKLKEADPNTDPFGQTSTDLAVIADGVPPWLDRMIIRPSSFMSLSVERIGTTTRALDRVGLRVRLKNTSGIALGVGPDRPINSQLLFAPDVAINLTSELRFPAEVIDAARRLRLGPREEMVFDVWPSMWPGSALVDLACSHSTRMRTRIIQGFVPSVDVGYQPGPLCLDADGPVIVLTPLAESVMGFDKLIEHLRTDPEEALPKTLAVLLGWTIVPTAAQKQLSPEQITQFGQTVAERYPSLSPTGKSLLLALMPTAAKFPAMAPLDEIALQETDARALPMVLFTRATDPDHAIFERAAASGDELVVRLGALLQTRLRAGGYAYSTMTAPGSGG
jgi:hypothetical protein